MSPRFRWLRKRCGWRWIVGATTLLAAGLSVWAWQASVHEARATALKEQIWRLEEERARIGIASRRQAQLEEELARIEADLVRLRPLLPEAFDVSSFVRQVERRYGVEVLVVEERPSDSGTFESMDVSVVLFGDRATTGRVPAMGKFVADLQLFWWKVEEQHDGDVEGVFTIFALPGTLPEALRPASVEPPRGSWLWPYAKREATLLARREELRLGLKKDDALRSRLRLFESRKAELARCVDTINALIREPGTGSGES